MGQLSSACTCVCWVDVGQLQDMNQRLLNVSLMTLTLRNGSSIKERTQMLDATRTQRHYQSSFAVLTSQSSVFYLITVALIKDSWFTTP